MPNVIWYSNYRFKTLEHRQLSRYLNARRLVRRKTKLVEKWEFFFLLKSKKNIAQNIETLKLA